MRKNNKSFIKLLINKSKFYSIIILCTLSIILTIKLYEKDYNKKEFYFYNENLKKPIYFLDNISVEVYFCPRDNCSQIIINLFENSKSIKCLFYDFNLDNISKILKYKEDFFMGVYDKNIKPIYYGLSSINTSSLMHNKYCIINDSVVITGSTNPTYNDIFLNNNNLIVIKSKKVSEIYIENFIKIIDYSNKVKEENEKSRGIMDKNSFAVVEDKLNNISVKICFSPYQNCRNLIISTLNESKKRIYFMTFSFTDHKIAESMIKKVDNGVIIDGIIEKKFFSRTPISIRKFIHNDTNPYNMHHKVFIIDENMVISGSYNPSYNAISNFENVIVIKDYKINKAFSEEFSRLKNNK